MDSPDSWILINGKQVSRRLLEAHPIQRCDLAECQAFCCSGGVLLDPTEKEKILQQAALIKPHLPPERRDETTWFDGVHEHSIDFPSGLAEGTSVVDDPTHPAGTTCVFLRPQDRYCALQVTSLVNDQHPWSLKPFFCALHPVTIDEGRVLLDEDNEIYIGGGHCQRAQADPLPLHTTFEMELKLVLGEEGYTKLKSLSTQDKKTADG